MNPNEQQTDNITHPIYLVDLLCDGWDIVDGTFGCIVYYEVCKCGGSRRVIALHNGDFYQWFLVCDLCDAAEAV